MLLFSLDLVSFVKAEIDGSETEGWASAGVPQAVPERGIHVRQLLVAAAGARMGDAGV